MGGQPKGRGCGDVWVYIDVDLVGKPKGALTARNHPGWSRWTFASPRLPPLSSTLYHFDPLPSTLYHWARKPRRKALPIQVSTLFPQTDRVSPRVPSRAARFPAPNIAWLTWLHMFSGASSPYSTTLCVYTGQSRFFYGCTIGYMCFLYTSLYSSCGSITDGTYFVDAEIRAYPEDSMILR